MMWSFGKLVMILESLFLGENHPFFLVYEYLGLGVSGPVKKMKTMTVIENTKKPTTASGFLRKSNANFFVDNIAPWYGALCFLQEKWTNL